MPTTSDLIALARLYAFVDTAYLNGRSPAEVVRQLCAGGVDLIQLRSKKGSIDKVAQLADEILPITQQANIPLIINDHLDIAHSCGAPICHLGFEDFFDSGYRHVSELPSPVSAAQQPLIGLSTHAPAQALQCIEAGADYIAIGPIYPTATKPTAKPVTLDYVRWASQNVSIPWFAIGGITLQNLDEVLAAGAKRICVVSSILNQTDVAKACEQFKNRLPCLPRSS